VGQEMYFVVRGELEVSVKKQLLGFVGQGGVSTMPMCSDERCSSEPLIDDMRKLIVAMRCGCCRLQDSLAKIVSYRVLVARVALGLRHACGR
jgi:hypothetical protein